MDPHLPRPRFTTTFVVIVAVHALAVLWVVRALRENPIPSAAAAAAPARAARESVSWHDPAWFTATVRRIEERTPDFKKAQREPLPFADPRTAAIDPPSDITLPLPPPPEQPKPEPPKPEPEPPKPEPEPPKPKPEPPKPKPEPPKPKPEPPKPKPEPPKPKPEPPKPKPEPPKPKPEPPKPKPEPPKAVPKAEPAERPVAKAVPKAAPASAGSGGGDTTSKAAGAAAAKPVDTGWYDQLIQQTFNREWRQPTHLAVAGGRPLVTKLEVTIRPDGTVASARIVRGSGQADMDASVTDAAKAVRRIPQPLPRGVAGSDYQIIINFKLQ